MERGPSHNRPWTRLGDEEQPEPFRKGLYYIRGSLTITTPGRNEPCYCGSGKKYKKCHWGERSRHRRLYVGYREQFGGIQMQPNGDVFVELPSGGRARADDVFTQSEAEREGRESKILNVVSGKAAMRLPAYLADNYHIIYVIDTNSKAIGAEWVSIACVGESFFRTQALGQADGVNVNFRFNGIMPFRNCPKGDEEKYSWWRLVKMIMEKPWYSHAARVGIITDHDRDNHSAYNNRVIPYFGQVFLPSNITLIYATTDAGTSPGTEDVTNFLLDRCEKMARDVLRQLEGAGSYSIDGRMLTVAKIPDLRPN